MGLRAKKPEAKQKRLKLFLYGDAGIGKTVAAIQFPNAYIIDTERGSEEYAGLIAKSGSVVFQTTNPDDIREEVRNLLTTKHPYRTLIIDPVTQVYNAMQEKWTRIFEKHAKTDAEREIGDFGMRYWGKVKSDFKGLERMLLALDMNVIVTAHQKDVYGPGFTKTGVTFDSMKGDNYFYDIIFQLNQRAAERVATTIKERAEPGKQRFPAEFPWSYENFLKFYGKDVIERESVPVSLASGAQVARATQLIELLKIDQAEQTKWLTKADVDTYEEMTGDQVQGIIALLEKRLEPVKGGK